MGVQKVRMPTGIKVVKISFRRIYLYGNRNDLGNQTRDCSCYILVNNIIYILLMSKNFERG